MNKNAKQILSFPYIIWMVGFTVIPLLMVFYYGLTDRSGAFTFSNVLAIMAEDHMKALLLSLAYSIVSTIICLLIAYPLAMILRTRNIGTGSFVVFIFISATSVFNTDISVFISFIFWLIPEISEDINVMCFVT